MNGNHLTMDRRQLIPALALPFVAGTAGHHAVAAAEQRFPDVLSVKVRDARAGTFDFDVTVSSPYDTPARYADGIRARSKDGHVYSERKLFHDHASEQSFARDMCEVNVPAGISCVIIEARDQRHRYHSKRQIASASTLPAKSPRCSSAPCGRHRPR